MIELLRGRREAVDRAEAFARAGVPCYCTAVTWAEICAGLRAGEEAPTRAFLESRREVVLDGEIGRRAGGYLARFGRSHGVEIADALIAASAAATGLRLWTKNRKHYPMEDVEFV